MKNKKTAGLTLTEMLCCVVIMLLVSIGMVNGVSLAVRNYQSSLMASESQVLCSTLTSIVSDELRYAGPVKWENPISFYSRSYGRRCVFAQNEERQVTLKPVDDIDYVGTGFNLLPGRAYHFGMKAEVEIKRKGTEDTFLVTVRISDSQNRELVKNDFEVEKLNRDVDPTTP